MSHKNTHRLVLAAPFAALCAIMTMVIQIPSPTQGYVNLGDCGVLLSSWLLGPWYGAAAAGIGSMLAEVFSGYALYAPATFTIKFLMAAASGCLFRLFSLRPFRNGLTARLLSGLAAESVMVCGYFLFDR